MGKSKELELPASEVQEIDCSQGIPDGYRVLPNKFEKIARKMHIEYCLAFWGLEEVQGRQYRDVRGIAVLTEDALTLTTGPKKRMRHSRSKIQRELGRHEAEVLGVRSDSRAFSSYTRGDIDADEVRRIVRITDTRHKQTDYMMLLLEGVDRDEARDLVTDQLRSALKKTPTTKTSG